MNQLLTVTVRDRSGILFQGEAKSVSSKNQKGPFDILPGHANFLSLIDEKVLVGLQSENKSFAITSGMISALNNEVTVLLGITSSNE